MTSLKLADQIVNSREGLRALLILAMVIAYPIVTSDDDGDRLALFLGLLSGGSLVGLIIVYYKLQVRYYGKRQE